MAAEADEALYPCPACGAVLYGWTAARNPLRNGERIVLDRCESCGLAVTRAHEPPDPRAELQSLMRWVGGDWVLTAPNRKSVQGGLGGAQWAGLEPELRRLHLSPESVRLLLAKQGFEIESSRTPYSRDGGELMRQTLINAFTLRDNFLSSARAGKLPEPASAKERWLIRLDYAVSYLIFVPCALIAYPLERFAAALGRGGVLEANVRPSEGPPG